VSGARTSGFARDEGFCPQMFSATSSGNVAVTLQARQSSRRMADPSSPTAGCGRWHFVGLDV